MNFKRSFSLLMILTLCLGMFSMICLPAAAANPVFIIDPSGTNGTTGSQSGVSGTVYKTYNEFEQAYTGTTTADVYFKPGHNYDSFTVTKKVNLYGPKKGIAPSVKGSDILQPWTISADRYSGETVIHGTIEIKTAGAGNDVLIDGFTFSTGAKIWVNCSSADHNVTIQNIVVTNKITSTDYFICAAPAYADGSIPSAIAYNMTLNLKNIHANAYSGKGAFIRYIAAKQAVLDNIYYANTTTMFLQTTAASTVENDFVMKNSFLYNNMPATNPINPFHSKPITTIYHDNPSKAVELPSVEYTNNVFYNAHGTAGYSIYFSRLNADADTRTFKGNTFVTDKGAVAPVNVLEKVNDPVTSYDVSKIVVQNNRMIGYTNTFAASDSNKRCTGKIDLSNNFTWIPSGTETLDFSTVAKCQALEGVSPVASGSVSADVDGLYFKDFDLTTKAEKINEAFLIDPSGTNGATATVDGRTATVYQTYADFEAAYTDTEEVDVFFKSGSVAGFTVTKKVNLYGAKHGIDPNVKGSGVLDEWTRNSQRNSGETIITGKIEIATAGKENDVLVDGFTISEAGQIWVNCSLEEHDVTIQNIVVSKNAVAADYCICAAPTYADGSIPSAAAYNMTLNLKNIYADGYQGTGAFIRYIAAKSAVLDNICYKNSTVMFLQTTAASTVKNDYVMKNSFLYNNMPTTTPISPFHARPKTTIYHDNPSKAVETSSITYTNNVFYNAYGTNGYSIYGYRVTALTDTRTFKGNTFVSTAGATAPVYVFDRMMSPPITKYDLSGVVVENNRMIGYTYAIQANNTTAGVEFVGSLDMSDNFTASYAADTAAMTGVAPTTTGNAPANVSGPYYTNFDMTISTDMLRVTGIDLDSVVIDGTTISGLLEKDNYVPKFTYTCGNDIARTMTIKNASGTTVSSINTAGTYTVTLGYGSQSRTYTLVVQKTTVYQGTAYMFDPNATTDSAYYWDGQPQKFTLGTNLFNNLKELFAKADADKVAVPQILLAPTTIAGNYTISHSCEVLGYHHGVNPVVRVDDPTKPDTLSANRGKNESVITGLWTIEYASDNLTFIFDGITLQGDGRFVDSGNEMAGETVSFKNIICSEGALSASTGQNARFGTKSYSEKALTFENIWADGLKLQTAGSPSENQIFYFTASDVVLNNVYMANSDMLMCANVFLQAGKDLTRDLSMTIQNSKFYKVIGARWLKFTGSESGNYRKYANRDSVKIAFKNNTFYDCADSDNSNPNGNAMVVFEYSYPCFSYEFTGNNFVEDREVYHFLTDKRVGTDVYNQFLHFVPQNHRSGEANYQSNLTENFKITGNRFIGRNTIINSENDLFNGSIELENNFFVSYDTVQSVKATTNWIESIKGENPNKVMNVRNTKNGVESYYLDYDLTTTSMQTGANIGRVDRVNHIIELTQTTGKLYANDLEIGDAEVEIYSDAACTNLLTAAPNCDALADGTHIYYLKYTAGSQTDFYTLVLHTATTEEKYLDATLYDPLAKDLPAGIKWYRTMNGKLYAFETGKTVFGKMDEIVVHTQTAIPNVLLPEGTYTASELQTVESVNYVCDKNAVYPSAVDGKKEKIKVICLGDSITLGTGASNRTEYAYPAQLQKLLDANHSGDYEVLNYGRGGSLGSNVSTYGYESLWNYSLALKENPDVVVLAFGTNDAVKTTHGRVTIEHFKEEMLEMIADFQALPSKPIIYMITTTDVQTTDTSRPQSLLTELRGIQRQTVQEAGIHLLDSYTYSLGWIAQEGAANIYHSKGNDTVHFNDLGYQLMANDYYNKGIDWTEQGAHQPDSVTITFSTIDESLAQVGNAKYESLQTALKVAQAGDTVKLLKDVEEDIVQVNPGVKLDLNGFGLTANYVIGFKDSVLYDGDTSNKGRLYITKDNVILDKNNDGILPVYDDAHKCYKLISVDMRQSVAANEFIFAPRFESFANNAIAAGAQTSGIRVVARVTWSDASYTAVQNFTYLDSFVKEVIDSFIASKNDYGQAFTATIKKTDSDVADLTISAAIISETGVELACEKLPFTAN